jgi:hypothetical protein
MVRKNRVFNSVDGKNVAELVKYGIEVLQPVYSAASIRIGDRVTEARKYEPGCYGAPDVFLEFLSATGSPAVRDHRSDLEKDKSYQRLGITKRNG